LTQERNLALKEKSYKAAAFKENADKELKRIMEERAKQDTGFDFKPVIGSERTKNLMENKKNRIEESNTRRKSLARALAEAAFQALPFGPSKEKYRDEFIKEASNFYLGLGCPDPMTEKVNRNISELASLVLENTSATSLNETSIDVLREDISFALPKSIKTITDRVLTVAAHGKLNNTKMNEEIEEIKNSEENELIQEKKIELVHNRYKPSLLETLYMLNRKAISETTKGYIDDETVLAETISNYTIIESANVFGLLPNGFNCVELIKNLRRKK